MPQMANYQEVGDPKPGATVLLVSTPAGQAQVAAAGHGKLRPRPHRAVRHRGKLALENVADHDDKTHADFLAADVPLPGDRYARPGDRHHAQAGAGRRYPRAAARGSARQGIQAGDQRQGAGALHGPGRRQRHPGADARSRSKRASTPANGPPKSPAPTWPRSSPGASRRRSGSDVLTFRREDGVAENFHTSQNRELLEKLSDADRRPVLQARRSVQAGERNFVLGSGHHHARNARPLGYAGRLPAGSGDPRLRMAAAAEVGGGMTAVRTSACRVELTTCARQERCALHAVRAPQALVLLLLALSAPAATFYVTISGLGGEPDYDQRFKMWADDIDSSLKKAGGDSQRGHPGRAHARADPRALRGSRRSRSSPPMPWC